MPAKTSKPSATDPAPALPPATKHPLDPREYPFARDRRGTPSREEIRRQSSATAHAARQSQRAPERGAQRRTHGRRAKKP